MTRARMTKQLSIRREVVEYGSVPVSAWLQQADGIAAIHTLVVQLAGRTSGANGCTQHSSKHQRLRCSARSYLEPHLSAGEASIATLAECLDVPLQHAEVG